MTLKELKEQIDKHIGKNNERLHFLLLDNETSNPIRIELYYIDYLECILIRKKEIED